MQLLPLRFLVVLALATSGACNLSAGDMTDAGSDTDDAPRCPTACARDSDCCSGEWCNGGICSVGTDCPSGCNTECSKPAGEVCNRATKKCTVGASPINCVSDCDCFTGEACISGACESAGADKDLCHSDEQCGLGNVCREGLCRPAGCTTRDDCQASGCLICKDSECVPPPSVCRGNDECCVGFVCNFGACKAETSGCTSDSDCEATPATPRCNLTLDPPACDFRCTIDNDCPAGLVCKDHECLQQSCNPSNCPLGQYCPPGGNNCVAGCDTNEDCEPPTVCNYSTNQCEETDCCQGACSGTQYCDTFTGECTAKCTQSADCMTGFTCDTPAGMCLCSASSCPVGSHCDMAAGSCIRDGTACDPNVAGSCSVGFSCDRCSEVCVSTGTKQEGDVCFQDAECDANNGLFCDNLCYRCTPPSSIPPRCRRECGFVKPCTQAFDCKWRKTKAQPAYKNIFLCVPKP